MRSISGGGAAGHVLIIDTSAIMEGKLEELRTEMASLVAFAEQNEPRTIAYHVYLNDDASRVTVMQIHPDTATAEYHMNVGGPAFSGFKDLVRMEKIDVYGSPSPDLLGKLREKAAMLGPATLTVHRFTSGFTRFGSSGSS